MSEAYRGVADAVSRVREGIAAAAARAGRDPSGVELMAVTKFHPIDAAEAAWGAGIRIFGESRVQEAEAKYPGFLAVRPGARLEMIGRLQSNKAKKAIGLFTGIQSLDSLELLRELDKRARSANLRVEVLLEFHTGEESKAGFRDLEELFRACDLLEACGACRAGSAESEGEPGLFPRGLMTMAPFTKDEALVRVSFRSLHTALGAIQSRFGFRFFDRLSMGMSNDYELAVEEGSTLLRLGTVLFGERAP